VYILGIEYFAFFCQVFFNPEFKALLSEVLAFGDLLMQGNT